jgi:hypothetical protein
LYQPAAASIDSGRRALAAISTLRP